MADVPTYDLDDLPDEVAAACIFWGERDAEEYRHEHIDNAIEDVVEDHRPWPPGPGDTVEVVGVVRTTIHLGALSAFDIVDDLIERLDEETLSEDDTESPRERMLAAAQALVAAVEADYVPWTCDVAVIVRVPVLEWVREHAPQWLEEVGRG